MAQVEYVESPIPRRGEKWTVWGAYRVTFDDGYTVMLPHAGVAGTIGAIPLNLDDPEARRFLLMRADEMRWLSQPDSP